MRSDYHVHTAFSDDSEYPMETVARDALALGLEELCFTDHVDYGVKRDWDDPRGFEYCAGGPGEPEWLARANVNYPAYVQAIDRLRRRYAGRLELKMGLEFGLQSHTLGEYAQLFQQHPWDFILLSIHEIGDRELWNQAYQQGRTQAEYNEGYYRAMLECAERFPHYSVLAHMDLITRYDLAGTDPFAGVEEVVRAILRRVIADGKGIEVNTSSARYGLGDTTPSVRILELYRELGGEILTIGSDSHKPAHLGSEILQTQRRLRDMGFRWHCTFRQMEPVFHTLL